MEYEKRRDKEEEEEEEVLVFVRCPIVGWFDEWKQIIISEIVDSIIWE